MEVPTGIATLHEDLRQGSHKANEDLSALLWDSEGRIWIIYEFRPWNKFYGGGVEEKPCFAMEGGSPQIRCEDNNVNVISMEEGPEHSGMVVAKDLHKYSR